MRTTTERLDIKLTNAEIFAQLMKANGYTVRTLTEAINLVLIRNKSDIRVAKTTIGYLCSGERNTVKSDAAKAIAELFGMPPAALFTPKVIKVTRQVPNRSKDK